jgi:predicted metal-dependent HD superfamily phosphohydrolase
MPDEDRWIKLVVRLSGNPPPDGSFNRISAAYSESHRYYHTFTHIKNCLSEFDEIKGLFESPDEVECALWLHDVVYDTHATDNEEKSAHIAKEILGKSRCPKARAGKIQELILSTRHRQSPETSDAQRMVDIDLAILGQPPEMYHVYEKNIRAEYSWVSAADYRIGRTRVMQSFLDRPFIYHTKRFQRLYEHQARENIIKALRALLY